MEELSAVFHYQHYKNNKFNITVKLYCDYIVCEVYCNREYIYKYRIPIVIYKYLDI